MNDTATPPATPAPAADERLFSLDLLRGLDMFLLTVIGPFAEALNKVVKLPEPVYRHFEHYWGEFTLWDMIMPLFIFMCGAAVPFALARRLKNGGAGWSYWRHVLSRVALLWVLGMVCQGRLLSLDPGVISPFNNTLQAIASGYLIAAVVQLVPHRAIRIAIPLVLAAVYTLCLHFLGGYSGVNASQICAAAPDLNFAQVVENAVVNFLTPAGSKALSLADPGYTWWFTVLMFGAMTLCGAEATEILLDARREKKGRALRLAALGAVLVVAGLATSPVIPLNKHLYTFTFTAQAMGISCLLLAALYALTDILNFRRGMWIFTLYGQTALVAYMFGECFRRVPMAFADKCCAGVQNVFPADWKPLFVWAVYALALTTICVARRAMRSRR